MIKKEQLDILLESKRSQEDFSPLTVYKGEDILKMEPPQWLLSDFVMEGGFTVLHGDAGVGKTFLALDWANTIANGWTWFQKESVKSPVLYVLAEGVGYLGARVSAWRNNRKASSFPPVFYHTSAVPLFAPVGKMPTSEQVDFLEMVDRIQPKLLVLDTLQRCTVGANENLQQDMGQVVGMIDTIRQNYGTSILAVHHDTKSGDNMRGSSVIRASAATTIQLVSKQDSIIEMKCTKQKDAEPFKDWNLVMISDPESGSAYFSAYQQGVRVRDYSLLRALADITTSRGEKITTKAWRDVSGLEGGSFERPKAALIRNGQVDQFGEGRAKTYAITQLGWDLLEQQDRLTKRPLPPEEMNEHEQTRLQPPF